MRTEAEIRQVLAAIEEQDPNLEDDNMSLIHDTLGFVLGGRGSARQFISDYVEEL